MHAARIMPQYFKIEQTGSQKTKQAHLTPAVIHHARVLLKAIDHLVLGKHKTGKNRSNDDKSYSTTATSRETRIIGVESPS